LPAESESVSSWLSRPSVDQRLAGVIRRKYGLEFTVVTFIERVLARGQKPRLILLIALTA
jgi:hypothetical protein